MMGLFNGSCRLLVKVDALSPNVACRRSLRHVSAFKTGRCATRRAQCLFSAGRKYATVTLERTFRKVYGDGTPTNPNNPTTKMYGEGVATNPNSPIVLSTPDTPNRPGKNDRNLQSRRTLIKNFQEESVLIVSEEVKKALLHHKPVVALETTIYTHGFPYPDNVQLALDLEAIVRKNGAIPATIAIIDGVARVGLSEDEITTLASAAGKPETMKVSRRDLPYIMGMGIAGSKLNGGTTVSGTMLLAQRAGIKVFGTGGLGGVHRDGENSMDVSADLTELGRTGVAVIASGCKSFLDIPRTLEFLETQGATVCTFADGRIGDVDFPAFYTRDSGFKSHAVVQTPREAAAMIYAQESLSQSGQSGFLFANPIPEEFSIPKVEIDKAINQAVQEAAEQGFHGSANTPFILSRIKDLTKGNSLPANRALIESNVAMAAKVAVELATFREEAHRSVVGIISSASIPGVSATKKGVEPTKPSGKAAKSHPEAAADAQKTSTQNTKHDIYVFGSVAVDLSCDYAPTQERSESSTSSDVSPRMHTSNIATISPSIGGVGHNVALAAQRASGSSVMLMSCVAEDLAGNTILAALPQEGLGTSGIKVLPSSSPLGHQRRTAQYVAINDQKKDLVLAMADMNIFDSISPTSIHSSSPKGVTVPSEVKWVVLDANWNKNHLRTFLTDNRSSPTKIAFEPVSAVKAAAIFEPDAENGFKGPYSGADHRLQPFPNNRLDLATPNQHELAAMYAAAKTHEFFESAAWWAVIDALGIPSSGARDRFISITNHAMTDAGIPLQSIQLLPFIPTILTKLGAEGVLMTELLKPGDARLTDPAAAPYILSRCANGTTEVGGVYMRLFPAAEVVEDVVSVNGVGDTFLGVLVAGLAKGVKLDEGLIDIAQRGAVMTLRSKEAVSPELETLTKELDVLAEGAKV